MINKFDKLTIENYPKIITEFGCWISKRERVNNNYYIQIKIGLKNYLLHRVVAYIYYDLPLDDIKFKALHKCNNKGCFNPEHIYVGTNLKNSHDSIKANTNYESNRMLCNQGHPLDGIRKLRGNEIRYCLTCNRERYYKRKSP